MAASVHHDPATGIWTIRLSGVVTPQEVLDAYAEMRASPAFVPEAPRLWDARETDAAPIVESIDLVRIARSPGSSVPHRVAVLVHRDVDFGMSRVYQAHAEYAKRPGETRVFRDQAEALAWLAGDPG
jgi:hypothetical protein